MTPRVLHFSAICLKINYIVYTHFDKAVHIGSSDRMYLCAKCQTCTFTVFEILGFKLKSKNNNNKKENWRIDFLRYLPCL